MALNSSGPISLAGTTAGQSIELELGGAGVTTISLNDTSVRGLAGVPSGAITMPTDFWGKSNQAYWIANVTFSTLTDANTTGLCLDNSGNVYLAGAETTGIVIFKLNNAGALQWAKRVVSGVSGARFNVTRLTLLNNGNIAVAGQNGYSSTREAAMRYEVSSSDGSTVSIVGNYQTTSSDVLSNTVQQVSDGSVYLVGTQSVSTNQRPTVIKFASMTATAPTWAWQIGTGTGGGLFGVSVDSNGDIIAVGYVGVNATTTKYQVLKFTSSGTVLWSFANSVFAVERFTDVKCFGTNIYICGLAVAANTSDTTVLKLNSSGAIQWARRVVPTTNLQIQAYKIDIDSNENIYVSSLETPTTGTPRQAVGIYKYNSSGVLQWQRRFDRGPNLATLQLLNDNAYVMSCGAIAAVGYSIADGIWVCVLPTDGSKTGTYTVNGKSVSYTATTYTETAYSTTFAAVSYVTPSGNNIASGLPTNATTGASSVASNI